MKRKVSTKIKYVIISLRIFNNFMFYTLRFVDKKAVIWTLKMMKTIFISNEELKRIFEAD